ncbi:MAG TPA: hypothetical protein VFN29_11250, partial [Chiayiivirga sp.]|nr:hypothetical protein [Chiayiivirga sp.]
MNSLFMFVGQAITLGIQSKKFIYHGFASIVHCRTQEITVPLHPDRPRHRLSMGSLFLLGLALACSSAAWSTEQTPPPPTPELFNLARVEAGHSGMWYDPSRSGEGWMLEVLPNDEAVVYWFTFDDQGNPRWLNGLGQVHRGANGDEIRFDDLIAVHGPRFG